MKPSIAWRLLIAIGSLKVAVHCLVNATVAYGYSTDELYFLDSTSRLAWGYVDHPPLTIVALAGWTAWFGDSLFAIRVLPALLGGIAVGVTGLLARELGGGRIAQGVAALTALLSTLVLGVCTSVQINTFEFAFWTLAWLLVLRILNGAGPRTWIGLGACVGLGLLTKYSLLWFGGGLFVGLLLTPQRRMLGTPWPWLAGALALAIFAPHVVWELHHDWPTFEFLRNKAAHYTVPTTPLSFVVDQILTVNPFFAPFWIGGLIYLLVADEMRPYRAVAWLFITVFGVLLVSGAARSYYTAGAYPIVFAAGAVAVERLTVERDWRWLPAAVATWLVVLGSVLLPFALPLLSPEQLAALQNRIPLTVPKMHLDDFGPIPQHLAERLHGPAVVQAITTAFATLSPEERERAGIFTTHLGQGGAVNLWGPAARLPRAIGSHNNYWLWGPGETSGEVMIVVWPRDRDLSWWFADVERVAEFDCPYCVHSLTKQSVYVGRSPKRRLAEMWPDRKEYH